MNQKELVHEMLKDLEIEYKKYIDERVPSNLCDCAQIIRVKWDEISIDILLDYMRKNSPRRGWKDFWLRTGLGAYWFGNRGNTTPRLKWLTTHIEKTSK